MERKDHSYIDVYVHFDDLDAKLQEFIIKRNELSMLAKEFADVVHGDLYEVKLVRKEETRQ